MKRQQRFDLMNQVYREYLAATVAVDVLENRLRNEPELLTENKLKARDFRQFQEHLSGTYLIRLFAVFEAALRDLWSDGFKQTTVPKMRDLLGGIAARRLISQDAFDGADEVRSFRNSLVHESDSDAVQLTLKAAKQQLSHYFSYVPLDW